jgi:DNA polymerase-4
MKPRKIIHIDMDAFYASVEQRDDPALRGKPVIVGGTIKERGVVAACSYEARKFGVRSAMSTAKAMQLCPGAILVHPNFNKYEEVSNQINEIFHEYTCLVEPASLDEAYLDVTENEKQIESATEIAKQIKQKIYEKTGLTASAGVSYNKFLAKVASGFKKPDGLTVVAPKNADAFISKLPIGSFHGVGKVTEKEMNKIGVRTGLDLNKKTMEELTEHFGKSGEWFYNLTRGIDDSPVEPNWERKSIGRETTLPEDITDMKKIREILEELCFEVEKLLKETDKKGKTITLKIKYFDFQQITRSITVDKPVQSGATIMGYIQDLLLKTDAGKKKIRLLGVSMHNFNETRPMPVKPPDKTQLDLPF